MNGLRIVFMGTPAFAIPTLSRINESRHHIVGVVSQPDRPRGRGKKLLPTPVKQFALENNLSPVLQPEKLKDPEFVETLQALEADIFVVVAYRILPEIIFTMPARGTINLHPSRLPRYRGAAPLNWTIINGDRETAITTIFIQKEIDAGNIILQRGMSIEPDETAGSLHDRLAPAGADLILESLDLIENNAFQAQRQDDALVTPAPKLTKEMCHISFDQPAESVKNWIHGLSPFPGAFAYYQDLVMKFYRAEVVTETSQTEPFGSIVKSEKSDFWIVCNPGVVAIREIQLQGRKQMKIEDFLRGAEIDPQVILK